MIQKIKNLFKRKKKKEKLSMPYEYCLVVWTSQSIKEGVGFDINKKIEHYKGDIIFKTYIYSEDLFESLSQRMPLFDTTEADLEIPIIGKISPEVLMSQTPREEE